MHTFGWSQPPAYKVAHYTCSQECFDRWAWSVVQTNLLGVQGSLWFIAGMKISDEYVQRLRSIDQENTRLLRLASAKNLTDAARYEDAAKIYESLAMWKEAGDTRRMGHRQMVTQVHVNVNELINQLRRAGLTANYTCPVCRSPVDITGDMSPEALTSCRYCGSTIQPTDLVDAIKKVIGY